MNDSILKLLQDRYFLSTEKSWDDVAKRVSNIHPDIYEDIRDMRFIPSSPTLMNANTKGEREGTLSSCFTMGIEDSIDGIFTALHESALVTKASGGIGYDFSKLRSSKEPVKGIGNRRSSGPLPFINMFNSVLDGVSQGGCFIGSTLVATANGPKQIKDIKAGDYVYSYSDVYTLKKSSSAWLTGENKEVWKLTTDKGLTIYATPDHRFLSRNKTDYIELKDLKKGMPLMPMTRYVNGSEWFISLHDGFDTRQAEHTWMMESLGYGLEGMHVHHKDHDHLNNNLDNLEITTITEHCSYHSKKRMEDGSHPFLYLSGESKQKRVDNFKDTCGSFEEAFKYTDERNHKVISVEFSHYEDVYDIEVGDIHNFVVCSDDMRTGVVVHNSRRGAGMSMLDIDHGDILSFINAKDDNESYVRFNFSVRMSDEFYKTLEETPEKIHQVKKITTGEYIDLVNDEGEGVTTQQLWDLIIEKAWKRAEPGLFNKDIAYRQCANTNLDDTVLSNPCAEMTNIPYVSCSLGSINLSKCVQDEAFNWGQLEDLVVKATRFINNTFEVNDFPIPKIKEMTMKVRPVGIGVMGLAHMLYLMKVPYNSKEAIKFVNDIMSFITLRGMQESVELAKKDGSYESYDEELFFKSHERFFNKTHPIIDIEALKESIKTYGIRNSSITSVAPTGTIATIAETSSGMEPVFALSYMRKVEIGKNKYDIMYINDPIFDSYLDKFSDLDKKSILKYVSDNKGSCKGCGLIPKEDQAIFVVASDLNSIEHLDMLEAVNTNVSLSTSKTVNLPEEATLEDVSNVYLEAYKRNVIGVTVYRDNSRGGILVHDLGEGSIIETRAPKRPKELPCHIYRLKYKKEDWIAFVGLLNGKPYEVFSGKVEDIDIPFSIETGVMVKKTKKRGNNTYQFVSNNQILVKDVTKLFDTGAEESITRMISTALRHGTPINFIVDQLEKSQGDIVDFNKVIARVFKKYLKDGVESGVKCPNCGEKLIFQGGCKECIWCGTSQCG